jgi:hypothetical protein
VPGVPGSFDSLCCRDDNLCGCGKVPGVPALSCARIGRRILIKRAWLHDLRTHRLEVTPDFTEEREERWRVHAC